MIATQEERKTNHTLFEILLPKIFIYMLVISVFSHKERLVEPMRTTLRAQFVIGSQLIIPSLAASSSSYDQLLFDLLA